MKESFEEIDINKEKRIMEFIGEESKVKTISIDERNRVLNKTRKLMETGKTQRLNEEEESILKEIAGVVYAAYKKYIEILDKNEKGGIKNEPEL